MATHHFALLPFSVGIAFVGLSVLDSRPVVAQDAKVKVDYAKVDTIFRKNNCSDCHSNGKRASAGLKLATYEGAMKGGRSGPAIQAGDSANSLLMKLVTGAEEPHMPPQGHTITKEEVATLKQWIDEGAPNSDYGKAVSKYYAAAQGKTLVDALTALDACREISAMKIDGVPTEAFGTKASLPILVALKDEDGWYAAANKAVEFRPLNAGFLNGIAWTIADPQTWLKRKDADLAIKAGLLGAEDSDRKSGAILDSLAWAYFLKGDKAKAIETEKEALKCEDATGETLTSLKESLKAFGG